MGFSFFDNRSIRLSLRLGHNLQLVYDRAKSHDFEILNCFIRSTDFGKICVTQTLCEHFPFQTFESKALEKLRMPIQARLFHGER